MNNARRGSPGAARRSASAARRRGGRRSNALLYERTGDAAGAWSSPSARSTMPRTSSTDGRSGVLLRRTTVRTRTGSATATADYLRSFNWAMAAMPELAPKGQSHLLGSSSVVQAVEYGRGRLAYRTFDAKSVEVVRLAYRPGKVVAGDEPLSERADLSEEGYVVQPLGGGDFVVRVRHDRSRRSRSPSRRRDDRGDRGSVSESPREAGVRHNGAAPPAGNAGMAPARTRDRSRRSVRTAAPVRGPHPRRAERQLPARCCGSRGPVLLHGSQGRGRGPTRGAREASQGQEARAVGRVSTTVYDPYHGRAIGPL